MLAPENKASVTQVLVEKYDLSKGDVLFTQEITGSYAYALEIKAGSLAGVPKSVVVTIYQANTLGDGTISNFQATTKTVTITANGTYILEDFYFAPKFMGVRINPNVNTGGHIALALTLNRQL
jgi:hypothetical protein